MNRAFFILGVLLFWGSLSFADEIKFAATVSKTQVGTGEQFEISFSVNSNGERFTPPDFSGFQILSGPNVSTSMESVNGNTTVSNSYSYILMALKEGSFTIGPASLVVNGKKYNTAALRIKVVKGQPVQQNQASQGAPDNSVAETASADLSKSLFIRAVVDKNSPYLGEQLMVSYRLYTRIGIEDSRVDKAPDLNGFYSQDIKNPQQKVTWRVETFKGLKYNVADLKQTNLFPEHDGNLTIDPMVMTFLVRQPVASRDIMDQFFGSYKEVQYKAKSVPVVIHVKQLPLAGKPDGFTGAIGRFKVDASIDKTTLKANESLNYKIKVTGTGNIKLLKNLNVSFPADFEKYDPKISDTTNQGAEGISGSRIYNYLLIPRHQGDFVIDPVKFSYFDPGTQKYISVNTRSFKIKVGKGLAENNVTAFSTDKQDIKQLNKDIRYIKSDTTLYNRDDPFFGSLAYYVLLACGPLACIGAYGYRQRLIKNNSNIVQVKSRKAGKVAAKHLASAQKQLLADNAKAFYEDVFRGLYGYLGDKLNLSSANLNKEIIIDELRKKQVSEGLVTDLLNTLDLCEMARYAPVTHISKQQVLANAKTIIDSIENEI